MDQAVLISKLSAFFSEQVSGEVVCAYLFGSIARDQQKLNSDVDLGVLFTREPESTLDGIGIGMGLAGKLERVLGRTVDLVVLNNAPVDLIHRVFRDGVLVHNSDKAMRIRFEVRIRNEYFDLLPFLRRYRQLGKDRAA